MIVYFSVKLEVVDLYSSNDLEIHTHLQNIDRGNSNIQYSVFRLQMVRVAHFQRATIKLTVKK